jgi:transcription initiation factor IIE alpha subunit
VSLSTVPTPTLLDEPLVTFQPTIFRLLGETSDALVQAVILQLLWQNRDDADETIMSAGEVSRRTGIPLTRVRRNILYLRDAGVISSRRSGSYDSTYAHTVRPQFIPGWQS